MSEFFKGLGTKGLEESEDRLGGFSPLETNTYTGPIKVAYAGQAASGARSVTVIVDFDGKEYRETIYITNKKGENWFPNKQDPKKKVPLPGFTTINDICLFATNDSLENQPTAEKIVKMYDPELKKEAPKSVPVLTELTGKIITLAISKTLENKNTKSGNGEYVPTAETRETNSIEKVFQTETKLTVAEVIQEVETATFHDAWLERNKGKTRDKRVLKDGVAGIAGKPAGGPPQANGAAPAARKSLFGAKA